MSNAKYKINCLEVNMYDEMNFDSLFTPFSIGKMEIKNRLIMAPMGTYAAQMDGSVSDTLATYFEERAKGGVGAIITSSQYLTPKLAQGIYGTYFDSKRIIPHLTGMTERMHCYGCKAIAQLSSGTGRNGVRAGIGRRDRKWCHERHCSEK